MKDELEKAFQILSKAGPSKYLRFKEDIPQVLEYLDCYKIIFAELQAELQKNSGIFRNGEGYINSDLKAKLTSIQKIQNQDSESLKLPHIKKSLIACEEFLLAHLDQHQNHYFSQKAITKSKNLKEIFSAISRVANHFNEQKELEKEEIPEDKNLEGPEKKIKTADDLEELEKTVTGFLVEKLSKKSQTQDATPDT